jgi:flagellar protein FlbD
MIFVTRLNGKELVVNSDMIQFIEATPDSVITLVDGKKLVVSESVDDIIEKIVKYRVRLYYQGPRELIKIRDEV